MNESQVERWNGTEADHWCTNADRYDAQLAPFLDAIMTVAAIGEEAVLDVGCGCGALSFAAAARARRVVGLDLSDRLLNVARDRATHSSVDNVEFVRGDAQAWSADEPFDVLVSRFGVMFFDDPEQAFTALRANVREGGRIVFASWQGLEHQAWLLEPAAAASAFLTPGDEVITRGPGMFGLADPSVVETLLRNTGFGEVSLTEFRTDLSPGGPGAVAEAVDFFANTGMARAMLADASPLARADAIAAVTDVFAQHHDGTAVHMDAAAWIVSAVASEGAAFSVR
ncbi:MAG: class I SAM-dependent methyltransferase [Acidimicrobiia bacterium]